MIYVDPLFWAESRDPQAFKVGARHGHKWCHLWCDPGEEEDLHAFAAQLGLRRIWFQNKPNFPHYDLVPPRRRRAIALGATEIPLLEYKRRRIAMAEQRELKQGKLL